MAMNLDAIKALEKEARPKIKNCILNHIDLKSLNLNTFMNHIHKYVHKLGYKNTHVSCNRNGIDVFVVNSYNIAVVCDYSWDELEKEIEEIKRPVTEPTLES